jgi:sugar-specific transcriptional regulator TrmB
MSGEDLDERLGAVAESMDLGEYEIAAYLAVLEHGDLTASEIAERTDVPQPRVYDTVRSLADRGLVELQETRPMRVVALDPEGAFADIRSSIGALVEDLETRYTTPARDAEAAALVRSRATILRYIEEVIADAEYELTVAFTPALLERFADDLAAAKERGVTIELVVSPASGAPEEFDYERVATAARARRGITTPVIAVADGEYSVYTTRDAVGGTPDRYGVIFNQSDLGFLVLGFFGTVVWTTADESLLEQDAAPGFPRHYASIRRCIKDIRGVSDAVYVTVQGRDILTGEARTLKGRVVETEFTEDEEIATLVVGTDGGNVRVGGRAAAYEDVEAHEILVGLGAPP